MDNTNSKVLSNFIWRFLERCGAQGVTFVVSIVLARLLAPEVYGVVALVTVFTSILGVFTDSGLANALIQKKDADDVDFSSVFYFNVAICLFLYVCLFLAAPFIAAYYEIPELTALVRVSGLSLIISGVKNVQQAFVAKNLIFKKFFFATLGGTIGAAVIGIWMAYNGYGVWALVTQELFNMTVDTIILWITVKWRPVWAFSFERLKELLSFGWKLLASTLLDKVYTSLTSLIIGKRYTTEDLAYYNKGERFPSLLNENINISITNVLLPAMSAQQDDREKIRSMTGRAIQISTYFMMPMMMGLAVCAEPLVRIVLTDKWLPCVPFLRIYCFTYAFYPVHTANLNAIQAMGRSDIFLKLEIQKKIVGFTAIIATMFISVEAMAYSLPIVSVICQIINSIPNSKMIHYSYLDQLKDMVPQICLSCVMGAAVYCVLFLKLGDWVTLIIQVLLGIAIYLAGSVIFKFEIYDYSLGIIKNILGKVSGSKEENDD